MDSKTLRLAVLLSATAIVLILLVVYAANMGSGHRGSRTEAAREEAEATEDAEDASGLQGDDAYLTVIGDSFRAYGEQIGNQPKAFLYDESFFDPMRDVGQGIREGDEEVLTLQAVVMDDTIHVSILNARGGLESGVAFQVVAEQVKGGREKTWTDTDRDGQIDLTKQANGNYRLRLLEVQGYEVPSAPVVVKVDVQTHSSVGASADADSKEAGFENSGGR